MSTVAIKRLPNGIVISTNAANILYTTMLRQELPSVYQLTPEQWRVVVRYTDSTSQWVLLRNGEKMRTRSFKRDWSMLKPLDTDLSSVSAKTKLERFRLSCSLCVDMQYKNVVGKLISWYEKGKVYIQHTINDTTSLVYFPINTLSDLTALRELITSYRLAIRTHTRSHAEAMNDFINMIKNTSLKY